MNKVEELIQQLCPEGVEYKELGDVVVIVKGKQLNKELLTDIGTYPAYNGGISFSGFTDNYNYDENTIIISQGGASAGFVNFITTKFYANAHCYVVLPNNEVVINRYVYHFLKLNQERLTEKQHGAGIPALKTSEIAKLLIPIPPLPVQQEIVTILDTFTQLEAELEAELEARKKQYEYYRNELLTFGDEVEWKTLGDICDIYDGTHQTPKYTNSGVPFVSVQNINNIYGTEKYISLDDFNKYKYKPRKDDLFMTRIGDIGTCALVENDDPLAYYVTLTLIRMKHRVILPRFLKHIIESNIGKSELYKRTLVNAVPIKINLGDIGKITIPIPPLAEQERIAGILDKFDALVNDISIGLPAEIEARRKQYEYYREKLLSFDRAE